MKGSESENKIWLSSPHMGDRELKYVKEAFDTNWIAPVGPFLDTFEAALTKYHGVQSAAALTSATAAIHLALVVADVQEGDHVICQSFTFVGSANPILYLGATPVFVDSELDTWNMDPALLREAIEDSIKLNKKPKAVIAVNLYGMPAKLAEIRDICDEFDIFLIEDAAESIGASINDRKTGSFGHVGIISFNGNKIITTSGGGAVLSNDDALIKRIRFLSTQSRDEAPHYQHSQIGFNYRMSNVLAAIGYGQMEVLESRVAERRSVHDRYFQELGATWLDMDYTMMAMLEGKPNGRGKGGDESYGDVSYEADQANMHESAASSGGSESIFPPNHQSKASPTGIYFLKEPDGFMSNRWLTTIIINPEETGGVTGEDLRIALSEQNIEARPLWKPMHMQPLFKDAPVYLNGVSEWLFEHGLCLPSGSNLAESDQSRVIEAMKKLLPHYALV